MDGSAPIAYKPVPTSVTHDWDGSSGLIPSVTITQTPSSSVASTVASVNKTKKKARRELTIAALDALVPIPYGQVRLDGLLANAIARGQFWTFWIIWGVGPIQSIDGLSMDDGALPDGAVVTHYTGAAGQGVDPTLSSLFAALGGFPTYAETLPGLAYSVIQVPFRSITAGPQFTAAIKGRKIYDPRQDSTNGGSGSQRLADSTTWAWSRNPTLILADFLTSQAYGAGLALDWSTVIACANANDVVVGTSPNTEVKRLADLTIDNGQAVSDWVETLRTAAGCWLVPNGDVTKLVADIAGSSVATYTHAAGQIVSIDGDAISAPRSLPTVVEIVYTDTTQVPWRDATALAKRPGVDAGTTEWRKASISMPWITRSTQANREAIEWLNKLWLRAASMNVHLMDEGLLHEVGDIITITYPDGGYASLPLRVVGVAPEPNGWALTCQKEDAGAYSSVVQSGIGSSITNLPDPLNPPTVTNVAVDEELDQVQTGRFASRVVVTWDDMAADYPFVDRYLVTIMEGADVAQGPADVSNALTWASAALKEDTEYTINVQVVATGGAIGDAGMASITTIGKSAVPSDVPSITGYEIGGNTRLTWQPATDLDLTAYELRYGAVGVAWASATLLDRVATPSLRYATNEIPAGVWDILIKALDSVRTDDFPFGQESVNAVRCTVDVTSDSNAFVAGSYDFTTPLLFNMSGTGPWQTDFGDTWGSLFTSAMSTYTNPLNTYHTAGTSGLVTETYDFGASLTGDFSVGIAYVDTSGAAQEYIETNNTGAESAKTITAATNATPIVITSTAHGYNTGDEVSISGVGGNTKANGLRTVTVINANSYSLQDLFGNDVAGNAAYTSGGASQRWVWSRFQATTVKATARFVRARLSTTGTVQVTDLGATQCNVVSRNEGGIATTSASAPTIIVLSNRYNKAVSIIATAQKGASPLYGVYDNVEVDGARGVGVGQALLFNGTSDYVDVSDSVPLRLTTALTLSAQLNLTANTGATQGIIRKDTETGTRYMWGLQVGISGKLEAVFTNTTNYIARSLANPPLGRWMHVAMTISGTTLSIYLDGIFQASATIAGTQSAPTGRMTIGANPPNVVTGVNHLEWLGGRIDDVRVWNYARTQSQIQSDMNTPLTGSESGLVGYWKFDSLTGTTATDSTSNANNGTVSGAKWRPLNGFDLYTYDAAGTQQAGTAAWQFNGV